MLGLVCVRFDLVSSAFLKAGGRRSSRVGRHAKPGARSLTVCDGVALLVCVCVGPKHLFGKG